MSKSAVLDPANHEYRIIPDDILGDDSFAGLTIIPVDEDFTWTGKRPDWDTLTIVDDLTDVKAGAIEQVNAQAEAFRMRFLTPGAGQAATYLKKETEARAWVSGDDPATAPFLACEATCTSDAAGATITIDMIAAEVIVQADAWIAMGSQIEGLRRGAAVGIAAATSLTQITHAATVDWESLLP